MQLEYYQKYLEFKHKGLKKQAKKELDLFIASFNNFAEKSAWTQEFLESGEYGHRIRYELYEKIIFPLLLNGYYQQDLWCIEWLVKTISNMRDRKQLHKKIRYKTEFDLLTEYYSIDPNNQDIRQQLLKTLLSWFSFATHEYWAYGHGYILWDAIEEDINTYKDIMAHVAFAKELDLENKYQSWFAEFELKVNEFFQRTGIIK